MKQDRSIRHAVSAGFDCSVFGLEGSVNPYYAVCAVAHDEAAQGFPIAVDNISPCLQARKEAPGLLKQLRFRLVRNPRARRKSQAAADIIKVARGSIDPPAAIIGFSSLVSERFCHEMADDLQTECHFVPVDVEDCAEKWFALWVTTLEPAIDEQRSRLEVMSWRATGEEVLRPLRLAFHIDPLSVKYLFRVSQWRYFLDQDLCTPQFADLLRKHKLLGAEFTCAGGTGPFVMP
jgi:hypothetical protein